jgi:hypothetical protein
MRNNLEDPERTIVECYDEFHIYGRDGRARGGSLQSMYMQHQEFNTDGALSLVDNMPLTTAIADATSLFRDKYKFLKGDNKHAPAYPISGVGSNMLAIFDAALQTTDSEWPSEPPVDRVDPTSRTI